MHGEAILKADVAITGNTNFQEIKSLRFTVEEEETLVKLRAMVTADHDQAAGQADFTFFLDGGAGLADIAGLSDGLMRHTFSTTAGAEEQVVLEHVLRLPKGEHRVSLQAKVQNAGHTLTVEGDTWWGYLTATRHSHVGTLAHGVDSKVQGIY
jgi:hypothetical protein